jgi:hypothetical protein
LPFTRPSSEHQKAKENTMMVIAEGPPRSPKMDEVAVLPQTATPNNDSQVAVEGLSKNKVYTITPEQGCDSTLTLSRTSDRDEPSHQAGSTALPASPSGRIRYQFHAVHVDSLPPGYQRNVTLPGNAKALLGYIGKFIARSENQICFQMPLARLSAETGISQRSLTNNIWKLREAGELLTVRVKTTGHRYIHRFTLPRLASDAVLRAAQEQFAADLCQRQSAQVGKKLKALKGGQKSPSKAKSHAEVACETCVDHSRSLERNDHHESKLQDAYGYGGPSPEQGVEQPNSSQKKCPAKNRNLSPTIQAEIAAKKLEIDSARSAERMRTESTKPTEAAPATREVPPAGPGPATGEAPAAAQLVAKATETQSIAEVASSPVPQAPAAPRKGKTAGSSFESLTFEQQAIVRSLNQQGVHRCKAIQLAASYPGKLIATVLHQLKSQRSIRCVPGWIVRAIERGGYKAAGVAPADVVANLQRLRARNAAEDEQDRRALAESEDRRRARVESMVHPARRQNWENDAIGYLTRQERALGKRFGTDGPAYRAAIWVHLEVLALTGRYSEST